MAGSKRGQKSQFLHKTNIFGLKDTANQEEVSFLNGPQDPKAFFLQTFC